MAPMTMRVPDVHKCGSVRWPGSRRRLETAIAALPRSSAHNTAAVHFSSARKRIASQNGFVRKVFLLGSW